MVLTRTPRRLCWFAFSISSITGFLFWRGEARRFTRGLAAMTGISSVVCRVVTVFRAIDDNARDRGFRGGQALIFSLLVLKYDL